MPFIPIKSRNRNIVNTYKCLMADKNHRNQTGLNASSNPDILSNVKVIADVCVVPVGSGVSVSSYVAECERIFRKAGLKTRLHAFGTNIEGEWEEVQNALKTCHLSLHEMGVTRILTTVKLSTRIDREQGIDEKIRSVESRLSE